MASMFKTPSVYGGAGGHGTRVSSVQFCYKYCRNQYAENLTFYSLGNNKITMQNLNDRLAFYIQKVQSVKNSNAHLEYKINEWSKKRVLVSRDYSEYMATIKGLHEQIQDMSKSTKLICRQIESACLAAQDFRNMYEAEINLRMVVERDISIIKKQMDEITLHRSSLEQEYESLREQLILHQKTHEKEIAELQAQVGDKLEISVDAAPSTDLMETLTQIREYYEELVVKNRESWEAWFQKKISALDKKRIEENDDLKNATTEVRVLKTKFCKLQTELESEETMTMCHKCRLQESEASYSETLANFQKLINHLDCEVELIKASITAKKREHETLEAEIKKYSSLLEQEGSDLQVLFKKIAVVRVEERKEYLTTHEQHDVMNTSS